MPSAIAKVSTWSNNPYLLSLLEKSAYSENIHFVDYKDSSSHPYVISLIDLNQDLSDISQKIISIYSHCRDKNQKLAVVIFHSQSLDTEKNLYFTQLLEKLGGSTPLHRLVIIKDIYHENLLTPETWLEKYILESIVSHGIKISSKGANKIFPLTLKDLVFGIQKTLFLSRTAGKTFWLVGDPLTDLDLAYLIKKNLEDIVDQFEIESAGPNLTSPDINSLSNQTRAVLNWEPKDDFPAILRNNIHQIGEDQSVLISRLHHLSEISKHPKYYKFLELKQKVLSYFSETQVKKSTKKTIESAREFLLKLLEMAIFSISTIYLLVTLSFISFTSVSLVKLEKSLNQIRQADIQSSVKNINQSSFYTQIGESSYSILSPIFAFFAPSFHEKNHNLFTFLRYSQSSLENLQQTYLLSEKIYQSIGQPNQGLDYADAGLALKSNLSEVYENINQIRLLVKNDKLPEILERKLTESPEYKNLSLIEQQTTQILKAVELLPAFLAGDTARNIVFIFQNSLEMRGTGGSLDYLYVLVLDQGRLVSKNIYTASDIDSLIITKISSPPLISFFTGSDDWRVRDINYNPNFTSTASNLSAVIERSLKFKPDIVIAVNDKFISSLLDEEKGILLNGQNVTSEIFKTELSTISPSPLYRQLIEYYLTQILEQKIPLLTLGRVIARQSMENQLLFWTANQETEKTIIEQPFSGAIFPHSCPPALSGFKSCLAQTTYVNESNFSLVPLGDDLRKKIIHKIQFSPNSIGHEYQVQFSFNKQFPNLNRDLYEVIQVYAPENSILQKVVVNDKDVSLNTVQRQKDNLLERFQIPISLKFNTDNQLSVFFNTPLSDPLSVPFAYSLTEYRQPGYAPNNGIVQLVIAVPDTLRTSLITAPASLTPAGFEYFFPPKTSTFGLGFVAK